MKRKELLRTTADAIAILSLIGFAITFNGLFLTGLLIGAITLSIADLE